MVCFETRKMLVLHWEELKNAREGGCGWEPECVQQMLKIFEMCLGLGFFSKKSQLCPKEMKDGVIFSSNSGIHHQPIKRSHSSQYLINRAFPTLLEFTSQDSFILNYSFMELTKAVVHNLVQCRQNDTIHYLQAWVRGGCRKSWLLTFLNHPASLPAGRFAEKCVSCVELQNMNFDVPF